MIFGKTKEQRLADKNANIRKLIQGVKKFAFLPVTLNDGRTVWLSYYYVYAEVVEYSDGALSVYCLNLYIDKSINHIKFRTMKHAAISI